MDKSNLPQVDVLDDIVEPDCFECFSDNRAAILIHWYGINPRLFCDTDTFGNDAMVRLMKQRFETIPREDKPDAFLYKLEKRPCGNEVLSLQTWLDSGANIDTFDESLRYTPLMAAVIHRRTDIVRFLLSRGANPDRVGAGGDTAFFLAAVDAMYSTVRQFVAHGADIHQPRKQGRTVLHNTVGSRYDLKMAKLLLDLGANVNAQDAGGMTPLLTAIEHGNYSAVKLLLNRGADVHVKNVQGEGVLEVNSKRLKIDERTSKQIGKLLTRSLRAKIG